MDSVIAVPHVTGQWPIDLWLMIVQVGLTHLDSGMGWLTIAIAAALPPGAVYFAYLVLWMVADSLTGGSLRNQDADRGAARHARGGR